MNRRQLLAGTGALAITACTPKPAEIIDTRAPAADPFSGASLMTDVEAYVNFGTHRTGSPGDLATSDWFARHWRALGYDIEQTDVDMPERGHACRQAPHRRRGVRWLRPAAARVHARRRRSARRWSMWDAAKPASVSGKIAIIHVPREPNAPSPAPAYRAAIAECVKAGAKAAVLLMSGPSGEVVAINTPLSHAALDPAPADRREGEGAPRSGARDQARPAS